MLMNQKKDLRAGRRMLEMDFVTRSGRNVTTDRPPLGSPLVPPRRSRNPLPPNDLRRSRTNVVGFEAHCVLICKHITTPVHIILKPCSYLSACGDLSLLSCCLAVLRGEIVCSLSGHLADNDCRNRVWNIT